MQLHPQVQAYFDRMTALLPADGPPLAEVPPSELRGFTTLIVSVLTELGAVEEPVAAVEDRVVPGPLGPIPVRVYTPTGEAPFPCLVWFHGGGWVIGDLEFVEHNLPRAEDRDDPRALLCGSGDLAGLPPAFVVLADHDVLLDEGRELGERLRAAGVPTRIETYPGVLHGFLTSSGAFDVGGQAVADVVGELRAAFA